MNEAAPLTGGCLCGRTRYQCGPPTSPSTLCHCRSCQRATGAHVVAWMTVQRSAVQWLGEPAAVFESSPGVLREFCARCGTPLSYRRVASYGDHVDLTIASLDQPSTIEPIDQIWLEDAVAWESKLGQLPRHARKRA